MTSRPAWTEHERLAALDRYDILDTPRERDFDDLARLAADLTGAPIAAVSLVDAERQWFKSEVGLGLRETPLDSSVCAQAISQRGSTIIPDLAEDPRFAANPLVTGERRLRFYAGVPLETPDGLPLGMLCVLDTASRPHGLTPAQHFALTTLSRQVTAQLELRRALTEARRAAARNRQVIDSATEHAIIALDLEGNVTFWNAGAERITLWQEAEMLGQSLDRLFTEGDLADGRLEYEMRRALQDGRSPDKRWHRRRDGERFWADGDMRPIVGEGGEPIGLVKVFSDRTLGRQAEQRLALLAQASAGLLAASEPDEVLGPLLERSAELLGFDQSHSYTISRDGTEWHLTRSIGGQADVAPLDRPLCEVVASSRRPLILFDLQSSSEPHAEAGRAAGLAAYAAFPVLANDRLRGVLAFGSATRPVFDTDAIAFFATLARFLAVVRERLDDEDALRGLNVNLERRVEERTRERDRIWQVSQDMLGVADERGVWQSVNPAWTRVLGWPAERIVGQTSDWLEHPDERGKTRAEFDRLAAGHAALAFENRLRAADGQHRLLSWTAVPADGLVYTVARDVTAERERETALRTSEDLTRLAMSAIGGVGVWTFDIAADRLTCDAAVAELHGLDPDAAAAGVARDRFLAGIHPDDHARLRRPVAHALLRSGAVEVEYRVRHADGRIRWMLSRGHTQFDASGRPTRTTGIAIETTRQRNLEEQLRQAQKMEAVGQLTGGLAHDFNNLLTGIVGSLELLQTRVAQGRTEGVDRYVNAAQGAARRASALTHRLLAFSRRQTLDPKATDPNRLINEMADLIRRTVGPAITVEMSISRDGWNTLVDPSQLENALLNLCINARDAMPAGGRLVVTTANCCLDEPAAQARELQPGAYVLISVSDDGAGMPPDIVARAFDPFFTTKPLGEGTGLGLSMTYGFVRQSGGEVRIQSDVGKGTTVSMLLPRHLGEAEPADIPAPLSDAPRAEHDQAVLVVDDEPTVRMLVAEVLEDLGYTALEASDGATAIQTLRSDARIDLLVTDVGLPGGMNGRQVADAGRDIRAGLKVLFITGYGEAAVLEPGMQVLAKPFAMEALASRIKDLLAGPGVTTTPDA